MATIKSIEEKAQRYDESIERAKRVLLDCTSEERKVVEYITPELAESEDEKIRKELVQFFEEKDEEDFEEWIPKAKVLAWLEKKGKQKETLCDKCKKTQPSHSCQDITALGRCALEEQGEQKLTEFEKAVKQVMEEAIECGDTHNLKADAEMLLSLVHKSAWSEDDELHIRELESLVKQVWTTAEHENDKDTIHKMSDLSFFLKTLKPQPKQEWSEEDEKKVNNLYVLLDQMVSFNMLSDKDATEFKDWLKSPKEKYTWKPSDEQIKVLVEVLIFAANHESPHWQDYIFGILKNLTRQLMKLREE